MVETLQHTKEQENLAGAKAVAWTSVFDEEGRTQAQMDQRMLNAKNAGQISNTQFAEYIQSQNDMIALMMDKGDGTQYDTLIEARAALREGTHSNDSVQAKFDEVSEYIGDVKSKYAKKGSFAAGAVHELTQITNTSAEEAAVGNGTASDLRKGYTGDNVVSTLMPSAINEVVTEDRTAVLASTTERYNTLSTAIKEDGDRATDYEALASGTRDELAFIAAGIAAADPEVDYADVKQAILEGLPENITGAQRASIELDLDLGQFYHEQWQEGEIAIAQLMSEDPTLTRDVAMATVQETNEFHGQVESADAIVRTNFGRGQRIDGEVTAGLMAAGVAQTYTSGNGLPDTSTDAGRKLNDSLVAFGAAERNNVAHQADVSVADATAGLPEDTTPEADATVAGTETPPTDTTVADADANVAAGTTTATVTDDATNTNAADNAAATEELTSKQQMEAMITNMVNNGQTMEAAILSIFMMIADGEFAGEQPELIQNANEIAQAGLNGATVNASQEISLAATDTAEKGTESLYDLGAEGSEAHYMHNQQNEAIVGGAEFLKGTSSDVGAIRDLETNADLVYLHDKDGDGKIDIKVDSDNNGIADTTVQIGFEETGSVNNAAFISTDVLDAKVAAALAGTDLSGLTLTSGDSEIVHTNTPSANDPDINQRDTGTGR